MHRFFSPSDNISKDLITISDPQQVHHIKGVLRLKAGDEIGIFDDKGREYLSVIEKLTFEKVIAKIKRQKNIPSCGKVKVAVACAIPKKAKIDDIIDKLIQLGVERIIPLMTQRVIVKLDEKKKLLRRQRWEKIALASVKQSQRNVIPVIEPVKDMEEALSGSKDFDLKLIAALTQERTSLKEVLDKSRAKNILVFIGPEGDFTPEEVDLAKKSGCIPVSLGSLVLRVDTAAIAAASFIMLYENG